LKQQSIIDLNISLQNLIGSEIIGEAVLDHLIPNSEPLNYESAFWDYKSELPLLLEKPSAEEKKDHNAKIADLIKDTVAFYNAHGGYIIFGVTEKGNKKELIGCEAGIDIGDFNQRLSSYTGRSIECHFDQFPISGRTVGILFIPKRSNNMLPAIFKKNGPKHLNGKNSFTKCVYVRIRDECRPAASTSEDWRFLHSDRVLNLCEQEGLKTVAIPAKLPSRDPDLVEFVGRDDVLIELRDWLLDIKSPVRLITGIGGLGKTTVAYKFAEEVITSGVGGVERLIWVSAKQTTFSALSGKLVETNSVDFTDIRELFEQLIIEVAGHSSIPEDASIDELIDEFIEVLKIYPCLVIVDDLDSLAPDIQRQCAAELQQVASRTVDRDHAPTRILMTSRLDQGLPPTSIIKIQGLSKEAFNVHVNNLCYTFSIPKVNTSLIKKMHQTTSGSPLFVGSLLRLVKLGENIKDICGIWKDKEGEDVREFAFERELQRLENQSALTLLAVILLGESSLEDLEQVLEISKRNIKYAISELQTYHLLATTENNLGDTVITASKDLVAVSDILKKHLALRAKPIEKGCARIRKENRGGAKNIGIQIRKIINCWDNEELDKALVIAKKIALANPKNGDVASVLGASYLKLKPPKFIEADESLEKARQLGCERKELLSNLIKAKKGNKDWLGLLNCTEKLFSGRAAKDEALEGFMLASDELYEIAFSRDDFLRCSELAISAVERIDRKISSQSLALDYFKNLKYHQEEFAIKYMKALHYYYTREGDYLDIFNGVYKLALARVLSFRHISDGCKCLEIWWRDVENRRVVDTQACDILQHQLKKMTQIKNLTNPKSREADKIFDLIDKTHRELSFRAGKLQSKMFAS
jgi:DNA polymerase III delta prime subunit